MAVHFSQDFIQKIKGALNIADIVGEHVVLRKSGANFSGLCPFHSERTPSFTVSAEKQLYHCYGCKRGGDLIRFYSEMHALSFYEALEELAERAKIQLPVEVSEALHESKNPEEVARRKAAHDRLQLAYRLNRFAAGFYHQQLLQSAVGQQNFLVRGISSELQRSFYLGAASLSQQPSWDDLAFFLTEKKAPLDLAIELGLIRASKTGKGRTPFFDLFRGRLIFPIIDLRGKVVGFGGRIVEKEDQGPKYLNSTDSFVFQKSKVLYGLYQAQKHIRASGVAIVVEGYFDVLGLHAGGFENTVATCGTALSIEHLQLLKRMCDKIILLFDSDRAGREATLRAMELGLQQGVNLYSAELPEGVDPDEVLFEKGTGSSILEGKSNLEKILSSARPVIDVELDRAAQMGVAGSPEEQTLAIRRARELLGLLKDPIAREVRSHDFAKKLQIPLQWLSLNQFDKANAGAVSKRKANGFEGSGALPNPNPFVPETQRPFFRGGSERRLPDKKKVQLFGSRKAAVSKKDRVVFSALCQPQFDSLFEEALSFLPQTLSKVSTLAELFDTEELRAFMLAIGQLSGLFDEFRATRGSNFEQLLQALDISVNPQLISFLREAVLADSSAEEVQGALVRSVQGALERISHQILKAMAQAEAVKNIENEAVLKKDYLDVQRKLKEFNSFYQYQ